MTATNDPTAIRERLVTSGEEWAEKEAAASWLEDSRKSVRAQLAMTHLKVAGSMGKAELMAEADQEYVQHLEKTIQARKLANIAKVNYEGNKVWVDLVRSLEATRRQEMNLR